MSTRPGVLTIVRWELRKLRSLKRTYLGLGFAAAIPLFFVGALALQSGAPTDVAFGRYVRDSALAIPLVLLIFGSIWLMPLIVALVAGDIVASEDQNGTLKTILTRSVDRRQLFVGKTITAVLYTVAALLVLALVALAAGGLQSGFHRLTTLSGTTVGVGRGFVLLGGALAVYLLPLLAITAVGVLFSILFRNSAAAIVGTLMLALLLQLVGILPGLDAIRPYLLPAQFNAWQALLRDPIDWAPIVRAAWVCALYAIPALAVGYVVFERRDVAGG